MQQFALLDQDSWIPFHARSYHTLPCLSDKWVFGELVLSYTRFSAPRRLSPTSSPLATVSALRYDGCASNALSHEPQLLAVGLFRRYGSPALIGHHLVDKLPQPDRVSSDEHLVSFAR